MSRSWKLGSVLPMDSLESIESFVQEISRRGAEKNKESEDVEAAAIMRPGEELNNFCEIDGEEDVVDLSVEGFLKKYEDKKREKYKRKKKKSAGFSNLRNFCNPPEFFSDRLMSDDLTQIIPYEEYTSRINTLKECKSKKEKSHKLKNCGGEESDNPRNSIRTKNFEFVVQYIIGENSNDDEVSKKDVLDIIGKNRFLLIFEHNEMRLCDYAAYVGNKEFLQDVWRLFPSQFDVNRRLSLANTSNEHHFPLLRNAYDERYVIRGDTLLHISARNGHYDVVEWLLEIEDIELSVKNSFEQCAYEVESRTRASCCCRNLIVKKVKMQLQSRIEKLEGEVTEMTLFNTFVDRVEFYSDLTSFFKSFVNRPSSEKLEEEEEEEERGKEEYDSDSFWLFLLLMKASLNEHD